MANSSFFRRLDNFLPFHAVNVREDIQQQGGCHDPWSDQATIQRPNGTRRTPEFFALAYGSH
jgi:hypothetical protein